MINIPNETPQSNKLLILYFFNSINTEVTKLQLNKAFVELDFLSYFDLMSYVGELCETDMLKERLTPKGEFLLITKKGKSVLTEFGDEIRHSFKVKIDEYCEQNKAHIEAEKDFKGDYYRVSDNEYRVMLKIYEGDISVFEINLKVYSEEDAKNSIKNWHKGAPDVYRTVFSMLT